MKKAILKKVIATYCDYCGAELSNVNHSSIEMKNGSNYDFCSNYSENVTKTCLDKFKEDQVGFKPITNINSQKSEIIQHMINIFDNTKRIHGKSTTLDWVKIAIHNSVEFLFLHINERSE